MAIRQSRGITLGKGTPQRLEGQNGDITIRSSRKGLKLYVKESNKWHSVDLDIDLRQIASTVRRLEDEVKRLSTKTNNTPVVDKLLLRQSGGTSSVGIQNKSGNIAFRNSTDTGEAKIQSVPFDIGTNNSSGKSWGQFYYDSSSKKHFIESRGLINYANLNNPDSTANSQITLVSDEGDSSLNLMERANLKYILGYDHLKADGSTSDARFKIDTGSSFSDDSVFNLDANGTYVMGNVGIGTTSPSATLDVAGAVNFTGDLTINAPASKLLLTGEDTSGNHAIQSDANLYLDIDSDNDSSSNFFQFRAYNTNLMRIQDDGNVGIGTTSPADALDIGISGSDARIYFSGNAGGGGSGILYKDSGGSARYALHFENNDKVILSNRASNGTVQIRANTSTAGASGEQTIATFEDDKVGIGTTSPTTTLDVEGTVSYKHTAFSTAGPTDGIDVSDTTVLEVDTSSNNVVIGGFSGGVQGQILHIVKTDTANLIQLEHNETPAAGSHQKIFLTSGSDERVVGYGGYTLYCNGASWFSLSNPTGAADAG